ncbi:MAG: glutamate-5-semialdehyde dehydrogenase [Lachnospiraceae bacterium]|nr:glutamate-5-semialdehyde dehydrogenase [Lachnospiraceae bacterium]
MDYLNELGARSKQASRVMNRLGQAEKNKGLLHAANKLLSEREAICEANEIDIKNAEEKGMSKPLIDRLRLTDERIEGMAEGLRQIAALEDPVGKVVDSAVRPNGLSIEQIRVPIGVIGIIYESRPNVTADAFGLCFKAGNAVILRGGSDAIHSNKKITEIIRGALSEAELPEDAILLIEDTSRDTAREFMRLNRYVDVLIPRGGAGLIRTTVENSTIPVIETGTGNCHVYVDESADFDMALDIIENAKTQRLGVCNACESLLVHEKIADAFLPMVHKRLSRKSVEMRGCERSTGICADMVKATEEDWGTEYLDSIISIKVVSGVEEAISHINKYNTGHSEAIVTKDYENSQRFLKEVDAAAVYVNASTRFTDGFEFGFGAEIGISTQKLHARGPMGLEALTSTKFTIRGNGQIRP